MFVIHLADCNQATSTYCITAKHSEKPYSFTQRQIVWPQFNVSTGRTGSVCGGLGCTDLLLLGLFLQEDGRLVQRQKLGRTVVEGREFGCSDVIQVFSVPLPPGLYRERRWAFRRLAGWRGSWWRDVTSVGQPGNTVENMLHLQYQLWKTAKLDIMFLNWIYIII